MNDLPAVSPAWMATFKPIPIELLDPRDYARALYTLEGIMQDRSWTEIAREGLSRPEYYFLKKKSKEFQKLAKDSEDIKNDIRHSIREDVAHDRATVGEEIPVYTNAGKYAGSYNKASDPLMALLLKAEDPGKYATKSAVNNGPGQVVLAVNIGIPPRTPQTVTITEGEPNGEEADDAIPDDGTEAERAQQLSPGPPPNNPRRGTGLQQLRPPGSVGSENGKSGAAGRGSVEGDRGTLQKGSTPKRNKTRAKVQKSKKAGGKAGSKANGKNGG